jgi:hypothetical protein
MISIATPHMAEDWWKMLGHNDLIAGRVYSGLEKMSAEEKHSLENEAFLRSFLEQARKVAKIASRHIGGEPSSALVHITRPWRRRLAQAAISHIAEGKNVKSFAAKLDTFSFAQGEMKGQVMGFWGKRMLPQVFKWSDEEKEMIVGSLDEGAVLNAASNFIQTELSISSFEVETGEEDIGKSGSAMPLAPSIVYN